MADIGLTVVTWGALACSAVWANSPRPTAWTAFSSVAFLVLAVTASGLNVYQALAQ